VAAPRTPGEGACAQLTRFFFSPADTLNILHSDTPTTDTAFTPTQVFRVDYPDGYVEDTGMVSLQQRQYHCLTLCYRSITTGELKQLKLCSLRPEEVAQWKEMLERAREDALYLQPRERATALTGTRPTPPHSARHAVGPLSVAPAGPRPLSDLALSRCGWVGGRLCHSPLSRRVRACHCQHVELGLALSPHTAYPQAEWTWLRPCSGRRVGGLRGREQSQQPHIHIHEQGAVDAAVACGATVARRQYERDHTCVV
jgi:hypothetical protein